MGKLHNLHMRIGLLLMICVLTAGCSPISEGESSQISESEENSQESMTDLSSAPEESESEADPVPQAGGEPVSYTHLDVYKRQHIRRWTRKA